MAKIVKMKFGGSGASADKNQEPKAKGQGKTPEEVRGLILEMGDGSRYSENLHMDIVFVPLDMKRTAIIGNYKEINPLIRKLGPCERVKQVIDSYNRKRGHGVIITVEQVVKLLDLIDEDGWIGIDPNVRKVAMSRYETLHPKMESVQK